MTELERAYAEIRRLQDRLQESREQSGFHAEIKTLRKHLEESRAQCGQLQKRVFSLERLLQESVTELIPEGGIEE